MTSAIEKLVAEHEALRQRAEDAERKHAELCKALARHTPEALTAQLDALASALKALIAQLERIGGHSTAQHQAELRHARALLVEAGG